MKPWNNEKEEGEVDKKKEGVIDYIEFWAVRHCNLNCKCCSSCSPIAPQAWLDPACLWRDLSRLHALGLSVRTFNVLGGEPLLHPHLVALFRVVHDIYPSASLRLTTNGILLPKMMPTFWTACHVHGVSIYVTCFPPCHSKEDEMRTLLEAKGVPFHLTHKTMFNKILVEDNMASSNEIFAACGCNHAVNLFDGKLFRCNIPLAAAVLNRTFGAHLVEGGELDLFSASSAQDVLTFLQRPNKSCRNCSAHPIKIAWERAGERPQLSDWVLNEEVAIDHERER